MKRADPVKNALSLKFKTLQNLGQSEHSGLQQGLCSLDAFVTISLCLFDKWKLWTTEWAVVFGEK